MNAKLWIKWSSLFCASVWVTASGCGASGVSPSEGAPDAGNAGIPIYDAGESTYDTPDAGDETPTCADAGTPENCGTCGNVCPGMDASADTVKCDTTSEATPFCLISCQGEHYDVDGDPSNGCEAVDTPLANHTQAAAISLGNFGCNDGDSAQNIQGVMPSDARIHEDPAIDGFNTTTGSAPDYYSLFATGSGTCENDINMTLTVTGSSNPTCYMLTASTDDGPYTCTTNASGTCSFTNGSGSYGNNSTITMFVSKTCSSAAAEKVSYAITGHL